MPCGAVKPGPRLFVEDVPYEPVGVGRHMFLVSPDGGATRPLRPEFVTPQPPINDGVLWSPDGGHLMFCGYRPGQPGDRDRYAAPAIGGPAVRTGAMRAIGRRDMLQLPCIWLPRHVIFVAGTTLEGMNLYRAAIHPGSWKVTGPVEQLTSGPGMKYFVNVAANGTMLPDLSWVIQIWAQDLDAATGLPVRDLVRLTSDAGPRFGLYASHNGAELAFSTYSGPVSQRRVEVRVRDLATGRENAPVSSRTDRVNLVPTLDARGANLVYQDRVGGVQTSFVLRPNETTPRVLCRDCGVVTILPGSGDVVVYRGAQLLTRRDLAGGHERDLLRLGAGSVLDADAAEGDRWLTVLWGRTDRTMGLYAVPVRDSAVSERDFVPLVEERSWMGLPRWSSDGSRVYLLSDRDGSLCVWMRRVDRASGMPLGEITIVLHCHGSGRVLYGPPDTWTIALAKDRLIFNATGIRGDIWQANLDPT